MKDRTLRKRALRAAKTVTLGAAIIGLSTACPGDSTDPDPDVTENDNGSDTGADVTPDVTPPTCSAEVDDVCPDVCTVDNDADCCNLEGGDPPWCEFDPEFGCACAVPGPFVAPEMTV